MVPPPPMRSTRIEEWTTRPDTPAAPATGRTPVERNIPISQPNPTQPPRAPFTLRRSHIIWGIVGLFVVCAACSGIVHSITGGGNSTTTGSTGAAAATHASTPSATNTPKPPTATPKPKAWVTVQHFSGSANTQTPTFHLPDGSRIVWTAKASNSFGGDFSIEMDNSDGTYNDLVANVSTPPDQGATYTIHGDLDVYLKVDTFGCNWTIQVQEYK